MTTSDIQTLPLRDELQKAFDKVNETPGKEIEAETLRLILCAVDARDTAARSRDHCEGCEETEIRGLLEMMAAQRRQSVNEYEAAGKYDLAEREREELDVINRFLPKPIDGDDLQSAVQSVVNDLEARSLKDLGKCISELKSRYPDQIDIEKAGKAVKDALL